VESIEQNRNIIFMPPEAAQPAGDLSPAMDVSPPSLRQTIERLARPAVDPGSLPFGEAEVDRTLGGGLMRGALHEVAPAAEGDAPAAGGFCVGILVRALAREKAKPVLWIRHDLATLDDGAPYGPGLEALGLDVSRILFVLAANAKEVLEAMEHALRSATLAAVFAELRGSAKLDLRASRRLALAAGHGATPALLSRLGAGAQLRVPVAAATRWRIASLASGEAPVNGIGLPRVKADLIRNRRGPAASFSLEWRIHDRTFRFPALRERLASPPVGRPHHAPAQAERRASA
jgi:protein ImuA